MVSRSLNSSFSVRDSSRVCSKTSIAFVLLSTSRRNARISETREACNVGVNLRGSNGDMTSSSTTSSKSLRPSGDEMLFGRETGDDVGPGEESPRACVEGGRFGVVEGVGNALAAGGLW